MQVASLTFLGNLFWILRIPLSAEVIQRTQTDSSDSNPNGIPDEHIHAGSKTPRGVARENILKLS